MPHDEPIGISKDGRLLYDNVATVVCVVIRLGTEILAVRRAIEPGKGKIALPGGHHMRGQTWQQCGADEVLQETGFTIDPAGLVQFGQTVTDGYGKNLIIAVYHGEILGSTGKFDEETEEVLLLDQPEHFAADLWAFPLHLAAAFHVWQSNRI